MFSSSTGQHEEIRDRNTTAHAEVGTSGELSQETSLVRPTADGKPRKPEPNRKPNRECALCKKAFYRSPSDVELGGGIHCSNACRRKSERVNSTARYICADGYVVVAQYGHPRAVRGKVAEHVLVAERALGRYLPSRHPVHHFNEIKTDNSNGNLVICENRAYHNTLHARQRVVAAGGDPDRQAICSTCKQVKEHSSFTAVSTRWKSNGRANECKPCKAKAAARRAKAAGMNEEKERQFWQEPCPCGHRRHTHGVGGCWASGCKCDLHYLLIPYRVFTPKVPEDGTFAA